MYDSSAPDAGLPLPVPSQEVPTGPLVTQGDHGGALVQIQLTEEQVKEWWDEIEASRKLTDELAKKWDILMKEYLPVVTEGAEDIKAGIHFRNVHTKGPKLFLHNPELILEAGGPLKDEMVDPVTGIAVTAENAAAIFKSVLKKKLGRKGVNTKRMVGECIFDILAWAGIGCTKLGYKCTKKTIQEPRMVPDPTFVSPSPVYGSMLGISQTPQAPMVQATDPATGQPAFDPTQVIIYEEWYWKRFSPKKFLRPADLTSLRFDDEAAWLGMEFFMPEKVARSVLEIPDNVDLKTTSQGDDKVYQHNGEKSNQPAKLVHGVEIFYKASIKDPSEIHPQAIRQLILLEADRTRAFVHRPSPDQTFDELGQLTPDSLVGFPFQIFTNRDLADSPNPPADTAFTNSAVKHINTHRRQSVAMRDVAIGKWLYDASAFTPDEIKAIKSGQIGMFIAVQDGRLSQGPDKVIAEIRKGDSGRDDFRTAQMLKQDIEETLGIGGVNAGNTEDTVRTATEISTSASALAERIEDEQGRILDDYLSGVEKFAALIQRYATDTDYIKWEGKDGLQQLSAWNKQSIAGKWAFEAKPDSQLRIDVARDRAQNLELLDRLAPYAGLINMKPVLKKVVTQFGHDAAEVVLPDMPLSGMGVGPGGVPPGPGGEPPTGALPNAPAPGAGTPEMERNKETGR